MAMPTEMSKLRMAALAFLLPGLAGLIISSAISVSYLERLPRIPDPKMLRMTPRQINGTTVYQTKAEDRRFSLVEGSGATLFLIGSSVFLVYLRKWGIAHAIESSDGELEYGEAQR